MKNNILIILVVLTSFTGCKKPFDPTVDANDKILVVDALVSNDAESYVKLSYAVPSSASEEKLPIKGAKVVIADELGNNYDLYEVNPGYYSIDSSQFQTKVGRTYKLFITTADGIKYESDPQIMNQTHPIDSIYGIQINKKILEEQTQGNFILADRKFVNSYINIKDAGGNKTNCRFVNSLLIEQELSSAIRITYLWNLVTIDDEIILPEMTDETKSHDILNFEESKFCIDRYYYNIPDIQFVSFWVLNIKEYALNTATYSYYQQINKQINGNGQLFDPISAQLIGNIHCISDKNKKVLGYFEVSSFIYFTYVVIPDRNNNTVKYFPTENIGSIPLKGGPTVDRPPFWREHY